jgi:hypothetical protein
MKMYRSFSLLLGLCLSLLLTNCTDPIDIGAELLDEDRASVGYTDTVSVRATTVIGDTIFSYFPRQQAAFYFGREVNPVFGVTEASLYLEPLLHILPTSLDLIPVPENFASATVDSVYLVLPLDSSGVYGDIYASMFGLEVYELAEALEGDVDDRFFSDASFANTGNLLGSTTFTPAYDTSLVGTVIDFVEEDTFRLFAPHLRVPLDLSFGQQLLGLGPEVYQADTVANAQAAFNEAFKGLFLKPSADTEGLIDFDLTRSWAGIYLYYTVEDTSYTYKYDFTFTSSDLSGDRVSSYQHDYSGALAAPFIGEQPGEDSLAFIQGLQGLFLKVEFPNLADFRGKVINQATLEIPIAEPLDYDYAIFPRAPQLVAMTQDSTGAFRFISEITGLGDPRTFFGGFPVEQDDGSWRYNANLSVHLQYILDQTEPESIYFTVLHQASDFPRSADRVILKGPGAASRPMLLKLSFTNN